MSPNQRFEPTVPHPAGHGFGKTRVRVKSTKPGSACTFTGFPRRVGGVVQDRNSFSSAARRSLPVALRASWAEVIKWILEHDD